MYIVNTNRNENDAEFSLIKHLSIQVKESVKSLGNLTETENNNNSSSNSFSIERHDEVDGDEPPAGADAEGKEEQQKFV